MRVTLKNGVVLEFDSTGMAEDFRECDKVARGSDYERFKDCDTCKCNIIVSDNTCKCNIIVGGTGICTINMHNSGSSKNI